MSFGWSAGDIATALRLLYKVGLALKETGGASSDFQDTTSFLQTLTRTLEHLNALQTTQLDPGIINNLREQCDHIRLPLEGFLHDVGKFQPALGLQSKRNKLVGAPRKLQWALSASKETRKLQNKIAVPMASVGLILGQQIVQNTLQMPADIQARMAHTLDSAIDSRIQPLAESIKSNIESLSTSQALQNEDIINRVDKCLWTTVEEKQTRSLEAQQINVILQNGLDSIAESQKEGGTRIVQSLDSLQDQTSGLKVEIEDVSKQYSISTDLVLRTISSTGEAVRRQTLAAHAHSSSLHRKLDQLDASMQVIQGSLQALSYVRQNKHSTTPNNEMEKEVRNLLGGIWLLLSSLQLRIRELFLLLAPYIVALYPRLVQMLILHGDRFLFEDALGRIKGLPCAEFQHWDNFYKFLVGSFTNEPGFAFVLSEQFMVLNGYNNFEISKKSWRAAVQPRMKVKMAMILDAASVQQGRCPDPSCDGRVAPTTTMITHICPICGKNFLKAEKSVTFNEAIAKSAALEFNQSLSDHQDEPRGSLLSSISIIKVVKIDPQPSLPSPPDSIGVVEAIKKDITAFKRVAWRDLVLSPGSSETIFACTFLDCDREFKTVTYWRIHENTHKYPEVWRCPRNITGWDICAYMTLSASDMKMHLRTVHKLRTEHIIDYEMTMSHLGSGTGRFWCGFCREVKIDSLGRLQHIENHLLGVSATRKFLSEEWYPINSRESRKNLLLGNVKPLQSVYTPNPNPNPNTAPGLDNDPTPAADVDAHSDSDSNSILYSWPVGCSESEKEMELREEMKFRRDPDSDSGFLFLDPSMD